MLQRIDLKDDLLARLVKKLALARKSKALVIKLSDAALLKLRDSTRSRNTLNDSTCMDFEHKQR
jgi:hypothetical protein